MCLMPRHKVTRCLLHLILRLLLLKLAHKISSRDRCSATSHAAVTLAMQLRQRKSRVSSLMPRYRLGPSISRCHFSYGTLATGKFYQTYYFSLSLVSISFSLPVAREHAVDSNGHLYAIAFIPLGWPVMIRYAAHAFFDAFSLTAIARIQVYDSSHFSICSFR